MSIERSQSGVVVSDKCSTTRKVKLIWAKPHPLYGKVMQRRTIVHVHDPENASKMGDVVEIKQVRPVSKTKTWQLVKVLEEAKVI